MAAVPLPLYGFSTGNSMAGFRHSGRSRAGSEGREERGRGQGRTGTRAASPVSCAYGKGGPVEGSALRENAVWHDCTEGSRSG